MIMTKKSLLIVDDDQDFAESLRDILDDVGFDVDVAVSTEDAIGRYTEKTFDAALVDVRMPGRDGIDCLEGIRAAKPGARVIMMTGFAEEGTARRAMRSGAEAVVDKPLDPEQLQGLIQRALVSRNVLILDDDAEFAESLEGLLLEAGYSVATATSTERAIACASADEFGILLLDLRLPTADSASIHAELAARWPAMRTVVVTAYAREERAILGALAPGRVQGVLSKPFAMNELVSALESC